MANRAERPRRRRFLITVSIQILCFPLLGTSMLPKVEKNFWSAKIKHRRLAFIFF